MIHSKDALERFTIFSKKVYPQAAAKLLCRQLGMLEPAIPIAGSADVSCSINKQTHFAFNSNDALERFGILKSQKVLLVVSINLLLLKNWKALNGRCILAAR